MKYLEFLTTHAHEDLSASYKKLLAFPRAELETLS